MAAMSPRPMPDVNKDDANLLHGKIKANSVKIPSDEGKQAGLGLYPFFSMINHSDRCLHILDLSICGIVALIELLSCPTSRMTRVLYDRKGTHACSGVLVRSHPGSMVSGAALLLSLIHI